MIYVNIYNYVICKFLIDTMIIILHTYTLHTFNFTGVVYLGLTYFWFWLKILHTKKYL